uniref:Uncharacterized protein n=1 Tax=Glossina brevipalpis TaxID=37001 RepID=A0A1A9WN85_9MUSC
MFAKKIHSDCNKSRNVYANSYGWILVTCLILGYINGTDNIEQPYMSPSFSTNYLALYSQIFEIQSHSNLISYTEVEDYNNYFPARLFYKTCRDLKINDDYIELIFNNKNFQNIDVGCLYL